MSDFRTLNTFSLVRAFLIIVLFLQFFSAQAKVTPIEGGQLNYRLIGFSWERDVTATKYKLEIAKGRFDDAIQFRKNLIGTYYTNTNRIIKTVPAFLEDYTWCVTAVNKIPATTKQQLHHFSCAYNPTYDTDILRLRIIKHAHNIPNTYLLADGAKAIYDLEGNLIWYMQNAPNDMKAWVNYSDMKVSPQGTITFLINTHKALEINYNGDTLWTLPGLAHTKPNEVFHHELTKTQYGHYFTFNQELLPISKNTGLSGEKCLYFLPDSSGSGNLASPTGNFTFSNLIEFDQQNNIVWQWKSANYFTRSDLNFHSPSYMNGFCYDLHPNSFYFDEKGKRIFISMRNESRIVEIEYPSGKVLNTYGETFAKGSAETGNELFNNQHSVSLSPTGNIWVYNNNVANRNALPKVILMEPSSTSPLHLKKVWEYECTYDGLRNVTGRGIGISRGGNVVEMPNSDVFVSMNEPFSKVFIVGRDKKEKWSGVFERFNYTFRRWEMLPQYRASVIVGTKEIEKLIWGVEAKER